MVSSVAALVFVCRDLERSVQFYKALGLPLREARHGSVVHHSCSVGGVHFALYPDDGKQRGPQSGLTLSFPVLNLEGALAAVRSAGGTVLAVEVPKPWGLTAQLEDPDGRVVELISTRSELTGPVPR